MTSYNARLDYPKDRFHVILQSSYNNYEFYGLDELERKKLTIIQAKFGCRHNFHTLPDSITLKLHKFSWNDYRDFFEIQENKSYEVQLNTLEETVVEYMPEDYLHYQPL